VRSPSVSCLAAALAAGLAIAGLTAAASQTPTPNAGLLLHPDSPEFTRRAPDRFTVQLDTTKGLIAIDMHRDWSPLGADRFYNLVRTGYYDEVRFHRVAKDKWAQFGINGTPAIAKAWRTATFPDDPFVQSNVRGTVAFAFAVKDGRTTQVFINLVDNHVTHDKEPFTPFGKITDETMAVVDALNSEYGENSGGGIRAGKQDPLFDGGNTFIDEKFPRLDRIKTARIR
jgi:cyclophilin family peptidyl-prolyl cis-trans isomerase